MIAFPLTFEPSDTAVFLTAKKVAAFFTDVQSRILSFRFVLSIEFLLGDDLLVAPVLEEGATSRDVYLPGFDALWRDGSTGQSYVGAQWIENYQADLYTLPYFIRDA